MQNNKVFFINNKIHDPETEKIQYELFPAEESGLGENPPESHLMAQVAIRSQQLNEGMFVEVLKDLDGIILSSANNSTIARRSFAINNIFRAQLIEGYGDSSEEGFLNGPVCSYHVNVGHGNCSFVVGGHGKMTRIWCIDCSDFDIKNKVNYWSNIELCINHIKDICGIDEFKIDKFLLTHPHFDHYSGVFKLLDMGFLSKAEIWINFNYSWPESRYNSLLLKLYEADCRLVEPISESGFPGLEIWHPQRRVVRSKTPAYKYEDVISVPDINNASVVYRITHGNISAVFPGDIETPGWNKVVACAPGFKGCNIYCISHHGSINGHLRSSCGLNQSIQTVRDCMMLSLPSHAVLMGRAGAYPGMPHQTVATDFNQILLKTDDIQNGKSIHFIKIKWEGDLDVEYY